MTAPASESRCASQVSRHILAFDQQKLEQAYSGKRCIVDLTDAEYAHIINFDRRISISTIQKMKDLGLIPLTMTSTSYLNLVPTPPSYHRKFDLKSWTYFPDIPTLVQYILVEEEPPRPRRVASRALLFSLLGRPFSRPLSLKHGTRPLAFSHAHPLAFSPSRVLMRFPCDPTFSRSFLHTRECSRLPSFILACSRYAPSPALMFSLTISLARSPPSSRSHVLPRPRSHDIFHSFSRSPTLILAPSHSLSPVLAIFSTRSRPLTFPLARPRVLSHPSSRSLSPVLTFSLIRPCILAF
ncbi:hypothetical protein BOTBODRAFT_190469 [Botryobasidium botryosum FD-172 SS1]|uniref:Uncharacterized protein n=1 Tax=Botryobasidium botryosum (strain FD-172 SS1) TaxID=930990 RepID=A0A067M707_BOTB1|nr:hypothetical protein BOTBODRAFT_190469 [Botryobasidium botryosum FD-172 SS1]